MSATTRGPHTQSEEQETIAVTGPRTIQGGLLIVQVFVAGAASLAIEMGASRLLAPDFGTDMFVWANLIGLILLYLTIGYYVGGHLADRHPTSRIFYAITALAAVLIALIPLVSQPLLSWSLTTFGAYPLGEFWGSLVAILLLFTLPTILLGCVSPYAIRLRIEQVGKTGRTAGFLYAISTAGSIVGTFLPVLVLLPDIGTDRTFLISAACLLATSLIGLLLKEGNHQKAG